MECSTTTPAGKRPRSPLDLHQQQQMFDPDLDLDNLHSHKRFLSEVCWVCVCVVVGAICGKTKQRAHLWRLTRDVKHATGHGQRLQQAEIQPGRRARRWRRFPRLWCRPRRCGYR